MARQTGRTTKMLTEAVMSDAPVVFIAVPRAHMIMMMRRMLLDMVGKPYKTTEQEILVDKKLYAFIVPVRGAIEKLMGIEHFDLFHDHTLFEDTFYKPETVESYHEMRELCMLRKARRDADHRPVVTVSRKGRPIGKNKD